MRRVNNPSISTGAQSLVPQGPSQPHLIHGQCVMPVEHDNAFTISATSDTGVHGDRSTAPPTTRRRHRTNKSVHTSDPRAHIFRTVYGTYLDREKHL
jgi:hypothetical protein